MRDQHRSIASFSPALRVQRSIAVEVAFKLAGLTKVSVVDLFWQRPRPQRACRHREVLRLKNSSWYGRSTRSWSTMMQTGKLGRSVSIG